MNVEFENRYTSPTTEELMELRAVADGKKPADLIIRGGQVLFVHTGEFEKMDIAVCGRHIAAITPPGVLSAKQIYQAGGQYVVPNFIESHFHIEYSMLTPGAGCAEGHHHGFGRSELHCQHLGNSRN